MHSTRTFLHQLQRFWRQEQHPAKFLGMIYLTPEQRLMIVTELLYPVTERRPH